MTGLDEIEGLRRQCIEGTQSYRAALIAAYIAPDRPSQYLRSVSRSLKLPWRTFIGGQEEHPTPRLLANVFLRPQRQQGKRDKVVLSDLAPYRKPWREWPLCTGPERELEPRTDPVTANELAVRSEYLRDHTHALSRLEALSRVEELISAAWNEYSDPPSLEE
jgi:hypothetical protein